MAPNNPLADANATAFLGRSADNRHLSAPVQEPVASSETAAAATSTAPTVVGNESKWVGQRIDKYVVQRALGCGGMGEVYLAEHRWLNVPVAIKILRPAFGLDTEAVERFHREARLIARLSHPNIVRAIDGGPVEDTCYLVTEFLDGVDLEQLVRETGPLKPEHACWVICEMAKGLQHAHDHQVVHRDVKPQNAMILRDGTLKILDLGLARPSFSDAATQMTATGQFMGTVDYVSPEQAIDTSTIDHRADIYSLGCTLYYLLSGRPPFHGEGFQSVISKILAHTDQVPEPIDELCRGLPRDLVRVLEGMMAKSPEERIQTAMEVEQRLRPHASPFDVTVRLEQPFAGVVRASEPSKDRLEKFADSFFHVLWIASRTLMSMVGILERVEVPSHSRIASKPKYRYRLSIKGILAFLFFAAIAAFIFMNIEIVPVEPPPGQSW